MYNNGGQKMQYDVLREFACRDDGTPVRMNAYVTLDAERSERDEVYRKGTQNFSLRSPRPGIQSHCKGNFLYQDENGVRYGKANADLDLADALLQSETWTGY